MSCRGDIVSFGLEIGMRIRWSIGDNVWADIFVTYLSVFLPSCLPIFLSSYLPITDSFHLAFVAQSGRYRSTRPPI